MQFSKTIGHQKQKDRFLRAIQEGRLAHAYALCGPEHIGKTTFALEVAEIIGADPILDVFLYDSEEGLSIAEARDLQNRLSLTPVGRHKVGIVSQAHEMTSEAANSLLKTLEEPPAHSLLLLTTSNFYALLPTIASRVQRVNFSKVSAPAVKESLREFNLELTKLSQIMALAGGRIGFAKRLANSPPLLEFLQGLQEHYQVLKTGTLLARLQSAQRIAELEPQKISTFLTFAMQEWAKTPESLALGVKLQAAWRDLKFNLNLKLMMDNLFLP